MPLTADQRKKRQRHLGASDAPAIMVDTEGRSLSPFAGPGDVYWSKVGEQTEDEGTEATRVGNYMEPGLIDFAQDQLGRRVNTSPDQLFRISQQNEILACNFDGLVEGAAEAVECKYAGQQNAGAWGEEGTDEVPDHVWIQCQHQAYVGDLDRVWVAAAIAGYQLDFRLYSIPRNDDLIAEVVKRETEFWNQHVLPAIPPEGAELPPMDVLKARHRAPGSLVELDQDAMQLIDEWDHAKELRKEQEDYEKQAKQALIDRLGEAEFGRLPDGRVVSYKSQNSSPNVDTKGLRADHPDIAAEYVSQGTHRVLRVQKAK